MNKKIPDILTIDDINNVIEHQQAGDFLQVTTPFDVFRYSSLRLTTILQGIVSISTYLMYYGPLLIVDSIGFDAYSSNVILNTADILTYYPLMLIVDKIHRKKSCVIMFGGATIISIIMIFLV